MFFLFFFFRMNAKLELAHYPFYLFIVYLCKYFHVIISFNMWIIIIIMNQWVWWLLSLSLYLLLIKLYYVDGRMYLRWERRGMGQILREVSAASEEIVYMVYCCSSVSMVWMCCCIIYTCT